MTYQEAPGPKLIFRLIAGAILLLFLFFVFGVWSPVLQGMYKEHLVNSCQDEHGVTHADFTPVFGFDYGGRKLVGDTPAKAATIECVSDGWGVMVREPKESRNNPSGAATLEVGYSAFSDDVYVTYRPANTTD